MMLLLMGLRNPEEFKAPMGLTSGSLLQVVRIALRLSSQV